MAKITKLTSEQEDYLPVFREQWRQVGLSTDRIDRDKAKQSAVNLYRAAGLDEPEVFVFSSPAMCLLARGVFLNLPKMRDQLRDQLGGQLRGQLGGQLWDQLWDQLGGQLWGQLRGQLRDQLWGQLRGQLWDQLRGQLRDQLWGQLRGQLWDQLRDQLGGQLRDQLWGQLWDQLWDQLGGQLWGQLWGQLRGQDLFQQSWTIGGHDAYWLSFYDFSRFIGANYTNHQHLDAYIEYAKHCGWMYAYQQVAFVSDRPTKAKFDDRGLLHCEDGLSVEFSDGWGICSWHGIRIPESWVFKKETLTADIALTHANVEQRRAACEILGWHNILRELNAKTIDKNPNPFVGELLEVDIPDIGREKFLRVKCGTEREFALPVPPDMERASQAQAWLNFTTEEMYLPQIRT